jgi:hypothetical protein
MPGAFRDVAGGHDLGAPRGDRQALGPLDIHAERHALEVQDDVGDILAHAGDGGELVQHVVDLDAGDGRALQRAHQHTAQRVAQRQAEAALERFGDDGRLARRVVAPGLTTSCVGLMSSCQFLWIMRRLHSCDCGDPRPHHARGSK